MSCAFTGIYFTVFILIFEVTPQPEFDFTCPSAWTDGAVENMKCVIPLGKFNATPSGLCTTYVDSVVFRLTTADGAKSAACTVTGIDATCDGSTNSGGCGCREKSGGNVTIDYNITAVKADYEGAHWECEPQCYDANGIPPVLSPPNTTQCFNTKFAAPTTTPPNTTTDSPGTTSTESPSSNTATSDPTTQHTGSSTASSPSETTTETTGNVSSATTASSEPSSSPSSISGPTTTSTENGSTNKPTGNVSSATTASSEPSSSPSSISGHTTTSTENGSTNKPTGNVSSTAGPASDLALYAGLGFVGLVCLVGIVVVTVLIVRRRKRGKDVATNSGNHSSPDQRGEKNYAYINTAL